MKKNHSGIKPQLPTALSPKGDAVAHDLARILLRYHRQQQGHRDDHERSSGDRESERKCKRSLSPQDSAR